MTVQDNIILHHLSNKKADVGRMQTAPKKYGESRQNGFDQIHFVETGGMAFNLLHRHVCYISMCIIQEYVTMTGLVTEYAIGSCGARLVQIAVVQLG
jgi:hypothetical protein